MIYICTQLDTRPSAEKRVKVARAVHKRERASAGEFERPAARRRRVCVWLYYNFYRPTSLPALGCLVRGPVQQVGQLEGIEAAPQPLPAQLLVHRLRLDLPGSRLCARATATRHFASADRPATFCLCVNIGICACARASRPGTTARERASDCALNCATAGRARWGRGTLSAAGKRNRDILYMQSEKDSDSRTIFILPAASSAVPRSKYLALTRSL